MAKGLFKPKYPAKYLGNPEKIRYLSSWELRFMVACDENPHVLKWGSEELKIPYFNPIKKKITNYLPDFIIQYRKASGEVLTEVIEIKPFKQAVIGRGKISAYDQVQLVLNQAKWDAAVKFCEKANIKFRVVTEKDLFTRGNK